MKNVVARAGDVPDSSKRPLLGLILTGFALKANGPDGAVLLC
jgi:hypothetical protein